MYIGNKSKKKCLIQANSARLLTVVVGRSELISLSPIAEALLNSDSTGKTKGVLVTIKGTSNAQPGYDFYSRLFAPWFGIIEDPVCGELKRSQFIKPLNMRNKYAKFATCELI